MNKREITLLLMRDEIQTAINASNNTEFIDMLKTLIALTELKDEFLSFWSGLIGVMLLTVNSIEDARFVTDVLISTIKVLINSNQNNNETLH